jgi:hypothetical protein
VDGLNSYFYLPQFLKEFPAMPHLYEPMNTLRLFTGIGMGLIITSILYPAFIGSIYRQSDEHPAIGNITILGIMIGISVVVDLFITSGSAYILYPVSIINAIGVISLLSLAYTILVLKVFHQGINY